MSLNFNGSGAGLDAGPCTLRSRKALLLATNGINCPPGSLPAPSLPCAGDLMALPPAATRPHSSARCTGLCNGGRGDFSGQRGPRPCAGCGQRSQAWQRQRWWARAWLCGTLGHCWHPHAGHRHPAGHEPRPQRLDVWSHQHPQSAPCPVSAPWGSVALLGFSSFPLLLRARRVSHFWQVY